MQPISIDELLLTILLISLSCVGLYTAFNIFLSTFFDLSTNDIETGDKMVDAVMKPFITCVNCFSTTYGNAIFLYIWGLSYDNVGYLLITWIACAYLNGLLRLLYLKLD